MAALAVVVSGVLAAPAHATESGGSVASSTRSFNFNTCDLRTLAVEVQKTYGHRGNIMVWKGGSRSGSQFNGVVDSGKEISPSQCGTDPHSDYYWAVFKDGWFERQGDGGYNKWAWIANVTRSHDWRLDFHGW
ncbi:hypothetical protein GCM10012280_45260 [Wenjunlia tyrosinilytica]|uniref:Uncharacterized protein n=2 Tax=Wenjunlia tyrosinilytica TaxID=1544741 RepID=A0A917ZTP9_9ACTN|nr:hypothetical protein GCM10012280_45260 [Wenjunlia tyrosinilytica]